MHKVFNEILLRGVLPALGQQIPRASDLGIFESQNCLRCPQDVLESLPHNLGTGFTIEVLSEILPMCAGQRVSHPNSRFLVLLITNGTILQIWLHPQ